MRTLRVYILPLIIGALLLLLVRAVLVTQYVVPASGNEAETLQPGDRVMVSRTSYGLHLPGGTVLGEASPEEGDLVAFRLPAETSVRLARCLSLPGDTVWIDAARSRVLFYHTTLDASPFVIPRSGMPMAVTPQNARLVWNTLRYYEHVGTTLINSSRILHNGEPLDTVVFTQDYFWMDGSTDFGLVPRSALVGRAFCVSWSALPDAPFFRSLRPDRFFIPIE